MLFEAASVNNWINWSVCSGVSFNSLKKSPYIDLILSACAFRMYSFIAGSLINLANPVVGCSVLAWFAAACWRSGATSPRNFNNSIGILSGFQMRVFFLQRGQLPGRLSAFLFQLLDLCCQRRFFLLKRLDLIV